MRLVSSILFLTSVCGLACAQAVPNGSPNDAQKTSSSQQTRSLARLTLLPENTLPEATLPDAPEPMSAPEPVAAPEVARLQRMKGMIKKQINQAIDSNGYPNLIEWHPLTAKEKFQVFLHSTYSPQTFANAAIDETMDRVQGNHLNPAYERGMLGVSQRYGIELSTNETSIFFQRFLFPTILKQDPRYFRNPDLRLVPRILYSMSRVVLTRNDRGAETFNASRVLGGVASRAVSDLYVPGDQQGMHPLTGCITFDLLRDSGMNLVHEFWPDLRHKFLHR
ncbi:MAG TPA: hypothetical protein VGN44_01315 [Candidatus Angelobacter sp.]|jgi:hypothetical protein